MKEYQLYILKWNLPTHNGFGPYGVVYTGIPNKEKTMKRRMSLYF